VRSRARSPSTRLWPLAISSPRMRPAGSRGVASTRTSRSCGTRHAPRAPASAPRAPESAPSQREPCARDSHARRQTRSVPRPPPRRDANHEVPRRAPPLGPAGRFAWTSKRSLDPTTLDAMRRARDGSTSCKFSSASGVGTVLDRIRCTTTVLA
jgi:hypothetical protein